MDSWTYAALPVTEKVRALSWLFMIRAVSLASFACVALFFAEYSPFISIVHIPYDLFSYHYPLADFAFQALRAGRFPAWDPTIYCGMTFVGNVQAALFYPPQLIMMAASAGFKKLPYQAMELLVFGHVWIGFMLSFLWFYKGKRYCSLAAILGAAVFALSGLMMLQLQHLGLVGSYIWMPLAFWGIDEAAETGTVRPLWKLVVAFAMSILAGFPSMWVVFGLSICIYAVARPRGLRLLSYTLVAMVLSSMLCAVQLFPALEAAARKIPETRYSRTAGIKDPKFFISYVSPNYYDFALPGDVQRNRGQEYLYLGAVGIVGLASLIRKPSKGSALPEIGALVVSFVFLTNPFGILGMLIEKTPLDQVFSAWYFLAGISTALAALAARGLNTELRSPARRLPAWVALTVFVLAGLWCFRLLELWHRQALPILSRSTVDMLIGIALCYALIYLTRTEGRMAIASAFVLIGLVGVEYKAFGTSKRFNAAPGALEANYSIRGFPAINDTVLANLLQHPQYRLARDDYGPDPLHLRHIGLSSPQGMDPLLTVDYRDVIQRLGHLANGRLFELDPQNKAALRLLGVRYFATAEEGSAYRALMADHDFVLMRPDEYYKIFQLVDSRPAFGWEEPYDQRNEAEPLAWLPERRALRIRSQNSGVFRLTEQYYPGWSATVDGKETSIHRCEGAFQCIEMPAGEHIVEFRFRSRYLAAGAVLSLAASFGFIAILWRTKRLAPR